MNLGQLKKIKAYLARPIDLEDIKKIEEYENKQAEEKKDLIQDIESTFSFLVTVLLLFSVTVGLSSSKIKLFNTENPELSSYILLCYVILSYVIFKFLAKEMSRRPLLHLRVLLILNILFLLFPLSFLVTYNQPSILLVLGTLASIPFAFLIPVLLLSPFIWDFYLQMKRSG